MNKKCKNCIKINNSLTTQIKFIEFNGTKYSPDVSIKNIIMHQLLSK